ncbi:MAG: hypothetical protein LBI68_00545 [Azoarcus sp.]|nr:hypothetical protein [Azoarcus sp.]
MKRISLIAATAFLLAACGTMDKDPSTETLGEHANDFEKTFRDFTTCDARFFRTLNRYAAAWKSVAPMESSGDYSWIKVEGRHEDRNAHVDFTEPPIVAGLELLSFSDDVIDLGNLGLYYTWGFTASGKMKDVVRKLKPLIHGRARLRRDNGLYVRTEVKLPGAGTGWMPIATASGTPAGLSRIERVFMIEPDEDRENVMHVNCSLQGGVNADILREERPDIAPKDYPVQLAETLFDDVKIPENVAEIARNTPWKPRFKKLSYTYTQENPVSGVDKQPTTETMEAQDNLVLVKEIYSPSFNVQRLILAGPGSMQLKARMSTMSDGRITLTTDLKVESPSTMPKKGDNLRVTKVLKEQPPKPGDRETQSSQSCIVDDEFDAKDVFPSLTGRAYRLSCTFNNNSDTSVIAYLEDLGINVRLGSKSKSGNKTYRITQFSVERDSANAK